MAVPNLDAGPSVRPFRARSGSGPLGLAVVGCGRFATFHARAARRLGAAVRIAFASRDPARAEAYRRRFGGFAAFGSYEEAAADPRVDALVVCTPHHLHETTARLAAEHGKAILLEKPIARTLPEADAILSAARSAGVVLMVAENAHFVPGFAAARAWLGTGAIGEVRQLTVSARGRGRLAGWRSRRVEMGGGLLIDGGIHYLHLMRAWAGPADEVMALAPPNALPGSRGRGHGLPASPVPERGRRHADQLRGGAGAAALAVGLGDGHRGVPRRRSPRPRHLAPRTVRQPGARIRARSARPGGPVDRVRRSRARGTAASPRSGVCPCRSGAGAGGV